MVSNHTTTEPEVSFNALTGEYHPSSLRLQGQYQDKTLNILMDSGSTYNFIKPSIAIILQLPTVEIQPFKVFVGSGDFIWCKTMSLAIPILI